MQTDVSQLPVRGNDAIEILTNDHDVIKSLLGQLTQATQTQIRKGVLEQLKAALTIHNATEENLVYPALNKVAGKKSESEKLYHETAEADVLIFELDTMLKEGDDSRFDSKATKLQAAILEHIEDEEEKAFQHLQDKAEPQQAQMLTQSVREFRNALRYNAPSGASATAGSRSETGEIAGTRAGETTRTQSGAGE
jgi:hemerythrin superfamily protein